MTKAIVHGLSQVVTTANADAAITVPGAIYNFADADGAIITLPNSGAAEGSTQIGKTYEFVVTVSATSKKDVMQTNASKSGNGERSSP